MLLKVVHEKRPGSRMRSYRHYCICDACGKELILGSKLGKRKFHFCDRKCYIKAQQKGGKLYNSIIETNIERYGVASYAATEMYKQGLFERFGVTNLYQLESVKQKSRETCLAKFGTEYASQSEEIKVKIEQTNLTRYGVKSVRLLPDVKDRAKIAAHTPEVEEKRRQTCLTHYGVENPFQAEECKEKIKQTNIIKYGVEHPSQSKFIQEKTAQKYLKKYGVRSPQQRPEIHLKTSRGCRKSIILFHWKTKQELVCIGSFEVAFVNWCNKNCIDFDWQIHHNMPDGYVYIIDAFIKTGEFANTWVEVKGWLTGRTKEKWEWFHAEHPENSQLWDRKRLKELGI